MANSARASMAESTLFTNAETFHGDCKEAVEQHRLSNPDLHIHLLGCGDQEFWVEEVMKIHLTKRFSFEAGTDMHVNEYPPLLIYDDTTKEFISREESVRLMERVQSGRFFEENFKAIQSLRGSSKDRGYISTFAASEDTGLSKIGEELTCKLAVPHNFFARVGWICEGFECAQSNSGFGDNDSSWAIDGVRNQKLEGKVVTSCECSWLEGDVVEATCKVTAQDQADLTFTVNGRLLVRFSGVRFKGSLRFAISLPRQCALPEVYRLQNYSISLSFDNKIRLRALMSSDEALIACFETLMKDPSVPKGEIGEWFKARFSRDVIYSASTLADSFCLPNYEANVRRNYVLERLGCNQDVFKEYVVFNARAQQFEYIRHGISNADLLAIYNSNEISKGFILNAFAMLSPDGEEAGMRDLAAYRGHFTPEFYPGRFALKDPIYSQRLDILHRLLEHLENRGAQSFIDYFEFSIGIGDASRRQVMALLSKTVAMSTNLQNALIPELESRCSQATFKYLAGFNRQEVMLALGPQNLRNRTRQVAGDVQCIFASPENVNRSWEQMMNYPHRCINIFWYSFKDDIQGSRHANRILFHNNFQGIFAGILRKLDLLDKCWGPEANLFEDCDIAGFDYFGDEFATPYCPFALPEFTRFSGKMGFRIHFGEAVPSIDPSSDAFNAWLTHMYLGMVCIYKCFESKAQVRIGHGVAISRLLTLTNTVRDMKDARLQNILFEHALSCSKVILREKRQDGDGEQVFGLKHSVPIEVNLTSNNYLLHDKDEARLVIGLLPIANCFLATDDDGIWPLNGSSISHNKIGLHGEYMSAIASGLIRREDAERMMECARWSKFRPSENGQSGPTKHRCKEESDNDKLIGKPVSSKVLFHPNTLAKLNRLELKKMGNTQTVDRFMDEFCPWLRPLPTLTVEPDKNIFERKDPDSEDPIKDPALVASALLTRLVFRGMEKCLDAIYPFCNPGKDWAKISNLFNRLLERLCRFWVCDSFVILRSGSRSEFTHDILVMENHPRRSNLEHCIQALLDHLASTIHLRPRIWVFVDNPPTEIHEAKMILALHGIRSFELEVFNIQPFANGSSDKGTIRSWPQDMQVLPLYYHSAIIPKLAEYCLLDDAKFDEFHPFHDILARTFTWNQILPLVLSL